MDKKKILQIVAVVCGAVALVAILCSLFSGNIVEKVISAQLDNMPGVKSHSIGKVKTDGNEHVINDLTIVRTNDSVLTLKKITLSDVDITNKKASRIVVADISYKDEEQELDVFAKEAILNDPDFSKAMDIVAQISKTKSIYEPIAYTSSEINDVSVTKGSSVNVHIDSILSDGVDEAGTFDADAIVTINNMVFNVAESSTAIPEITVHAIYDKTTGTYITDIPPFEVSGLVVSELNIKLVEVNDETLAKMMYYSVFGGEINYDTIIASVHCKIIDRGLVEKIYTLVYSSAGVTDPEDIKKFSIEGKKNLIKAISETKIFDKFVNAVNIRKAVVALIQNPVSLSIDMNPETPVSAQNVVSKLNFTEDAKAYLDSLGTSVTVNDGEAVRIR